MSILKTINQLMTTLESSKDILERLELIAAPAIILALQHEFVGESHALLCMLPEFAQSSTMTFSRSSTR
jgi:hypothetical protein